jgi:starch phosphorylase
MIETSDGLTHMIEQQTRSLPEPLRALEPLAWNYWWSWGADGASLFRDLDPAVWEVCEHNPRRLLAEISEFHLMQKATDPVYIERVRAVAQRFDSYMAEPVKSFGQESGAMITPENPVAYFCAEYGVHNSLPLYSGGLGILAGDHLKSASDIGLPLVAIGLLYRYGYFRQRLTREGWQEEHYGESHPAEMPIHQVMDEKGAPLFVEVLMRERNVRAHVWRVDVGRVRLYLLDTNIEANEETDRWVTGHLYGGDRETRVVQEMLLGIGGVRLLRKLKIEPHVHHLNEGHSAFLTLELARELTEGPEHLSFAEAAKIVRERCVFTTHTPIAAGNDAFPASLIEKCFGSSYEQSLGLTHDGFLDLGRVDTKDDMEWYGLSPLAIKMSRKTNGVSRKHGEVSRELWLGLWPEGTKVEDVPITSVTNGVHAQTWVAPLMRSLFQKYIGEDWANLAHSEEEWAHDVEQIPDAELWAAHCLLKQRLIAFIRHRSFHARLNRKENAEYTEAARHMFDPQALTIGFARRVAGYKRWKLLLAEPERLMKLIDNAERPVQFVFAGKAHPQDQGAKLTLQQLAVWKYDPRVMRRAVFLQDYDQEIARHLVQSVDVWLNVPRRPLEASGTSGQKVGMNGGLNLSILDGWWVEGYDGTNGWAIGDVSVSKDEALMDAQDAESLYRVLEEKVVPQFYERDADGLPRRWIKMMKRSIETLLPVFNSDRMVAEYASKIYL